MTCGDQQNMNTKDAPTSILANRRRERSVEVCGSGNSDGGTRSRFVWARILCPYRNDLYMILGIFGNLVDNQRTAHERSVTMLVSRTKHWKISINYFVRINIYIYIKHTATYAHAHTHTQTYYTYINRLAYFCTFRTSDGW